MAWWRRALPIYTVTTCAYRTEILVTLSLPMSDTQMASPSNTSPMGSSPTGNVPSTAPSEASLIRVSAPVATQITTPVRCGTDGG